MSSLSHHGIKGQRWGVRRFQNKDGTRTAVGKKQLKAQRLSRNEKGIRDVYRSLSDEDFRTLGYSKEEVDQERKDDFLELSRRHTDYDQYNRVRYKDGKAVGYIAATGYQTTVGRGKKVVNILVVDLAVHSEYRGNGYSVALGKDLVRWFDTYGSKEYDRIEWYAMSENIGSQKAAERSGFTRRSSKEAAKGWVKYRYDKKRKAKHTSIGGIMYIEGNALILGDSSYLEHHGILGQKWGVRRFQNKDGTRTAAGKARDQKNAAKSIKNAKEFRSSAEQFKGTAFGFGADKRALKEEKAYGDMAFEILNNGKHKAEYDDLSRDIDAVASFEYEEYSKKRDAMIEINARISLELGGIKNPNDEQVAEEWVYWADFDEDWGADLKGNSYDRYLVSKGYNPNEIHKRYKDDYAKLRDLASKDAEEYLGPYGDTKITYKDKYTKETVKTTAKEELANKIVDEATIWMDDYGAAKRADLVYTDKELSEMRAEDAKYSPLKHSALFIEDGTLCLSHHGIRGQRWGVRRFQNRDGSLTNAGRKRLGYATKGAAQTVGKAFKAGVKAGGNAVKAVKAHHEKKEAEKLQKKKEKASKTRAGVSANKDLFTAKELKELNAKFEEQDKLTMARLKKGVEIAKAVGQYAQTAKQIGDAYQSITGKNILSHLTEIKSANEAKSKEEKEAADKTKAEAEAAAKKAESKAMAKEALQKNIDAFKADQESNARVKDLEKQGNKTAAKTKLAEYIDRYNQDKAAQEQTKQMMKNQKLQEYIDRANQAQREKDAATLKETTERGKQVIDVLKRHNTDADLLVKDYQNRTANTDKSTKPSSAPSSNNLMAQIRAAQTKLEKPNKNETPAEHKEAQKKLNALEEAANEYKAAANKPGTDPAEVAEKLLKKNKDILDDLKHMDFSDGTYLEHYGVRGMKWGKHLMAGKGEAGAGGGGGEDDEKLKEMAKKAGMSVAEFRTKMAGKLSGAASKVGEKISVKDKHLVINGSRSGNRGLAVGETGEKPKSFKEKAYNALGGKYKTQAAEAHREMVQKRNDADDIARRANAQGRAANANKRAGNVREYMANKEGARQFDKEAKGARVSQWEATAKANRAQWKYDHSIAGLYDKATGKYKQVHKRTKVPKTMDQAAYYYSEGPNSKLHNNGSSKAKTAKEQAKAAVWNAADHQIKAREYNAESADYGHNANAYGQAYKDAAEREGRLSEASYRRAAALGKQASSETSTSSRPRARKKKHTSGGSGVTVRRPGRKPVSRTKRVTKSSTGVKRRGSTGSGRSVR